MKHKITAVMLSIVLLLGLVVRQDLYYDAIATAFPEITISHEGNDVASILLPEHERRQLTAQCSHSAESYSYQWQIDAGWGQWVDIYGQTADTLDLSYAMLKAVMDDASSSSVRCNLLTDSGVVSSEPVGVTVSYAQELCSQDIQQKRKPMPLPITVKADSEYITITVNYLDAVSQNQLFSPYTATIHSGSDFTGQNIISPTFLGYAPYYSAQNPDTKLPELATASALTIQANFTDVTENIVINVYYKAIDVPYSAKYYFQNIHDDLYTENVAYHKQSTAKTGTIISDAELTSGVAAEGFTKLYHYPESISADGSTVFECYYDRNYYLMKFDMNGGYGVDPIYARYDTPFVVNQPTRHGYVFGGWDLLDESGSGDGVADPMPSTIPAENRNYRAIWQTTNTTYTVVYWRQNPDDDGYSFWGSTTRNALSATTVSCDNTDKAFAETLPEYRYAEFSHGDSNVEVHGDGSTVLNVYYTRKVYTLKFYYARQNGSTIQIVGGSTYGFSDWDKTNDDVYNAIDNIAAGQWGTVTAVPELNALGQSRNYTIGSETGNNKTYYYIAFSARYGADISELWPLGVFDPIKTGSKFTNGNYAFFSAWNVEHHCYYREHCNANYTLKGNYMRLDYQLLYNYELYEDRDTVCFFAFFENGANINWSQPNQWIYRIYLPVLGNETGDHVYNNVSYRLAYEYDTCDNNETDKPNDQTATAVEGFTNFARTAISNGLLDAYLDDTYQRSSFTMNFYYRRNNHTLSFNNYGNVVSEKTATVPFDAPLADYDFEPAYPDSLEENGYAFGGWYTSPGCYDGTEFYWDTEHMPANDLMLYAKWTSVMHTVNFFKTYDAMRLYETSDNPEETLAQLAAEGLYLETKSVVHGNASGSIENPDGQMSGAQEYEFAGWFYMENGVKKAYTPLDMPVTQDMNIFADWGSRSPQPYIIHYAQHQSESDAECLELLDIAADSAPQEQASYTITHNGTDISYVYLDGRYHRCVANDTIGFGYQGSTRTFKPKAGDPYNQLYPEYNKGYFPLIASHSITMQYEEDKTTARNNVYTFTYVRATDIQYTVRYLDKNTGQELAPSVQKLTADSVVTERFLPIAEYIPDNFYKRLVLAVEEDPKHPGQYIGSADNEIIFYYTTNKSSSFYAVHFMLQKPGTDGTNYAIDGSGDYEENDSLIEGIADNGAMVKIAPLLFNGFTVVNNPAYIKIGNRQTSTILDNGAFSMQIDTNGSELYIFYTRNQYDYKVYYLEYGTDISNLSRLETVGNNNGVLQNAKSVTGIDYDALVTETAPVIAGFNCVSTLTQSIRINYDSNKNFIIFYYAPLQYTAEYRIAGGVGGTLSQTLETIYGDGSFIGSSVTLDIGYRFDGWFLDEACTIPAASMASITDGVILPDKSKLTPSPATNIFYAKVTPQYGSLTIQRTNTADEGAGTQVFCYRITNQKTNETIDITVTGNSSTTITQLLYGSYTVEQMDWSWRYPVETVNVTLDSDSAQAEFSDSSDKTQWLSGSSAVEINRKAGGDS